jgi:Trk-type K+ transport system membrane component
VKIDLFFLITIDKHTKTAHQETRSKEQGTDHMEAINSLIKTFKVFLTVSLFYLKLGFIYFARVRMPFFMASFVQRLDMAVSLRRLTPALPFTYT